MLESRYSRLEEEVERLSKELCERGEEALKESKEHEALITRSMEERKRLQVTGQIWGYLYKSINHKFTRQ